jgi:hypothetical protein
MSKLTERSSVSAPDIQKTASRSKECYLSCEEGCEFGGILREGEESPPKHSKATPRATPEPTKPKRKLSAAGRKAISEISEATKKRWAAERAVAKKLAPAVAKKSAKAAAKNAR